MERSRLFDLVTVAAVSPVAIPLTLGLAGLVKLTSPGPSFFRQQRMGRHRKPFTLYKLRSMRAEPTEGPHVTAHGDRRVTALGRVLRATKLDELPQLYNVLKGDMSLVGPRPESPRYVAAYPQQAYSVFDVRPGIIDDATIAFRDEEKFLRGLHDVERAYREVVLPQKLKLSIRGLQRRGLFDDARLFWDAGWAVAGRMPQRFSQIRHQTQQALASYR